MSLLLCADCGGSKTSAIISSAETGEVLSRILGGPSNFTYLGLGGFVSVVEQTLKRGLEHEGVRGYLSLSESKADTKWNSAWIAISGVDTPSDVENVTNAMSSLLSIPKGPRLKVTNDTHLLAGPLITQSVFPSCVTVGCGTGSCVVSFRKKNGGSGGGGGGEIEEMGRSGGYGWILGDEGSGFQVGRETVRVLCIEDDIANVQGSSNSESLPTHEHAPKPTRDLRSLVLAYFGLPPTARASDIFGELYAPDPNPTLASAQVPNMTTTAMASMKEHFLLERQQRLSRLPPAVFKSAFPPLPNSSSSSFIPHPLALRIVQTTASELAEKIALLCSPSPPPQTRYVNPAESLLCLGGSLVKQPGYRALLVDILKEKGCDFAQVVFVDDCEKAGADALYAQVKREIV